MTTGGKRAEYGFSDKDRKLEIERRIVEGGVKCDDCGGSFSREIMQAHHIVPISFLRFVTGHSFIGSWIRHVANMSILCPVCHEKKDLELARIRAEVDRKAAEEMIAELQKRVTGKEAKARKPIDWDDFA